MNNQNMSPDKTITTNAPTRILLAGEFVVDTARHALLDSKGERVELRNQALDLLCLLAKQPGEVIEKRVLLENIWPGMVVTDDSLVQAVGDIRRAINDTEHHVLQTVPRRGYRLIATAPAPATGSTMAEPQPSLASTAATPPRPSVKAYTTPIKMMLWASALLVLGTAFAAWQHWRTTTQAPVVTATPDRPPIAVLDFSDPSTPAEDQQLARAYSEDLTNELARNADLRVISAQSSLNLRTLGDSMPTVAQRLGVVYLIAGTLRREAALLHLQVQLLDGRNGQVVWAEKQSIAASEIYTKRASLTERIAGTLHTSMRFNEEALSAQRPPANMDIYAMTLRAITLKHRFAPKELTEARGLLEQVVAQDPQYAPGWVYLGMVNGIDYAIRATGPSRPEMLNAAIEQAEHGLNLNRNLAAGYLNLIFIYPFAGRHMEAINAGERCLTIAPSDSDCMMFLAFTYAWVNQPEKALSLARKAVTLYPIPPAYVLNAYTKILWMNGLTDEAMSHLDVCLREAPYHNGCRSTRIIARVEKGMMDEAKADYAIWRSMVETETSLSQYMCLGYMNEYKGLIAEKLAPSVAKLEQALATAVKS